MSEQKGRKMPGRTIKEPARFRKETNGEEDKSKKKKPINSKKTIEKKKKSETKKAKKAKAVKGKDKGKGKKSKKEARVPKSAVLVKKNRGKSDRALDEQWRTKLAQQSARNIIYSEGSARTTCPPLKKTTVMSKPAVPADKVFQWRDDMIAPDLITAVKMRVSRFLDRDQVKLVPDEFRLARAGASMMSKRDMKRDKTGFNFLVSSFKPAVDNVIVAPAVQEAQRSPLVMQGGSDPPPPPRGNSNVNNVPEDVPPGETLTFAALVSHIPQYIRNRLDKASKLMYLLRMIFTRDEIARCSLTGKKSPYPSFESEYGAYRIGLFYRVATEDFQIDKREIATLICKRINYIRNSPRILKKAHDKRAAYQEIQNAPDEALTQAGESETQDLSATHLMPQRLEFEEEVEYNSQHDYEQPGMEYNAEHDYEQPEEVVDEPDNDEDDVEDEEESEDDEEEDEEEESDDEDYDSRSGDEFEPASENSSTEMEQSDDNDDYYDMTESRCKRRGRY